MTDEEILNTLQISCGLHGYSRWSALKAMQLARADSEAERDKCYRINLKLEIEISDMKAKLQKAIRLLNQTKNALEESDIVDLACRIREEEIREKIQSFLTQLKI